MDKSPRNGSTENSPSFGSDAQRLEQVTKTLAGFYAIMGNAPDTTGALAAMAEILCQEGSDEQITSALNRCMHECRFPVRLPDILQRIPGVISVKDQQDAEVRAAWDTLTAFVRKYVGNDVHGNFGPEHGWYPRNYPRLSDRILDTVRRTGGWKVYARMSDGDFPFVQRRFFEEYLAWVAVERVDRGHMLAVPEARQLGAGASTTRVHENVPAVPRPTIKPKPIPNQTPLTAAQLADRREMLRQQAESLSTKQAPRRSADTSSPPTGPGSAAAETQEQTHA